MTRLPLRHAAAAKGVTIAYAAAALAAVATAVIFLLPRPAPSLVDPDAIAEATPPAPPKPRRLPTEGLATDWTAVVPQVDRLQSPLLDEWRKLLAARQPEPAQGDPDAAEGQPVSGFAPPWRYLGAMRTGGANIALVVIDGRQRFVTPGWSSPDGYRVADITPTALVVEQGRARHTLTVVENTRGQNFTTGAAFDPSLTFPAPGAAPQPAMSPGQTQAEIRRARRAAVGRPAVPPPSPASAPPPGAEDQPE